MRVATRITMATAAVVLLASLSYAFLDLRSRRAERRASLEREARAVATALRFYVEAQPAVFRAPTEAALRDLTRAAGGWRVAVLPSPRGTARPVPEASEVQLRRLNAMILVPRTSADVEAGQFYLDLPIRGASERNGETEVVGMLELARSA